MRFFNFWPELLPGLVQSACVDLAGDEEMGHSRPALRGALRHQPGDGAAAVYCGRCSLGFRSGENVRSEDFSTGARSADVSEIDAAFVSQTPRFGGNLNVVCCGLHWSRGLLCRR